jgi:PAS domain S-box-containing protein
MRRFAGLGYAEADLLAMDWASVVHPDDLGAALAMREQLLKQPNLSLAAERRYIHRSGSVIWGRMKVSVVLDPSGNPQYFVGHLEDVTERKQNEALLIQGASRLTMAARAGAVGI